MPTDDPLITPSAAAKAVGINKSTMSRQIKAGSIRSHGGKVRLSEVLEDRAANIDLSQSHRRPAGAKNQRVAYATAPDGAPQNDATEADLPVLVDGRLVSFAEALRIKENYLAKLRHLEFDVKSGSLVDAAAVHRAVFELARAERDALANWPSRVAPLIAAEIGANQIALALALEKHVRSFLSERSTDPKLHFQG